MIPSEVTWSVPSIFTQAEPLHLNKQGKFSVSSESNQMSPATRAVPSDCVVGTEGQHSSL